MVVGARRAFGVQMQTLNAVLIGRRPKIGRCRTGFPGKARRTVGNIHHAVTVVGRKAAARWNTQSGPRSISQLGSPPRPRTTPPAGRREQLEVPRCVVSAGARQPRHRAEAVGQGHESGPRGRGRLSRRAAPRRGMHSRRVHLAGYQGEFSTGTGPPDRR